MADIYFPDGTKLSDYTKKISVDDLKIQKSDPMLTLNNTSTGYSDIVFQRSGIGKANMGLDLNDNLDLGVGTNKAVRPAVTDDHDLGNTSYYWRYIYGQRVYIDDNGYYLEADTVNKILKLHVPATGKVQVVVG